MIPELPDDVEIGYCRSRLLPVIVTGAAMTLLSASIAFEWFPYQGLVGYHLVIGYAGIAFFGLATLKFVRTMFAVKGPVVFVSRYGIRDLRVANEFILWDLRRECIGLRKPQAEIRRAGAFARTRAAAVRHQERAGDARGEPHAGS